VAERPSETQSAVSPGHFFLMVKFWGLSLF
jgi:hypothetical protein